MHADQQRNHPVYSATVAHEKQNATGQQQANNAPANLDIFSPGTQKKIIGKLYNGKKIVIKEKPPSQKTVNQMIVSPERINNQRNAAQRTKTLSFHQPSDSTGVKNINFQRILQSK